MNILISGARGFIGSALVPELQKSGHTVTTLSRSPGEESRLGVTAFAWDPLSQTPPPESLAGADAVIYLSGETVAQRWTDDAKEKIHDSRVVGTRHLVEGIANATKRPKALICSSATGYYGDRGEEELTEESTPGESFLAGVCQAWEREADQAAGLGLRVVKIRTGMVLGSDGGALKRMITAFRTKMGGKLASGKQWMSWIHLSDLVALYEFAAANQVSGVLNGTSPHPVRNEEFTEALGEALNEPSKIAVPEFALKMMFGEMAEVMLASQKVFPIATERAGFTFRFPDILAALQDAVH